MERPPVLPRHVHRLWVRHRSDVPEPLDTSFASVIARWRSGTWWVLPGAAVCCIIWLAALPGVRLDEMAGWGLLDALPWLWYVGFGGTVAVYLSALLSRRPVDHSMGAAHVMLVAVLYGTTSLIYDAPRLAYTYKHIGVVEWFLQNESVDRSIDIYHNFPGFFYLVEVLHRITSIPVHDMALWTQPVLSLVSAGAVYWVAGACSTSRRVRYGAAFLFTLGDWVGQNYFAPQGLAFPVALFVLGGLLRSVPPGAAGARWGRHAVLRESSHDADVPECSRFWSSGWGTLVLVLAFGYIVVSHQLTAPTLILQTIVVCLVLRPASPWLPVVFILMEAAWLAQAWSFLTSNFRLLDVSVDNAAPPELQTAAALPGFAVAVWAAPALMATMFLLTVAAMVLALLRRRVEPILVPALVAAVPALVIVLQPYGQEAVFRVYLYALPWAAVIIAGQFLTGRVRQGLDLRAVATSLTPLLATLLLLAVYSSELISRVAPSDVAANAWFERQTPDDSLVLPLTPGYPLRSTADYDQHLPSDADEAGTLVRLPGFAESAGSPSELIEFTRAICTARAQSGSDIYLAVGPYSENYVRLYGTVPLERYQAYVDLLLTDPGFKLAFIEGESMAFLCS